MGFHAGRPIVSSSEALSGRISQLVNFHLRSLVEKVLPYIKDTAGFLLKLESVSKVPPGSLLVKLDVHSLYTNIPYAGGVKSCS